MRCLWASGRRLRPAIGVTTTTHQLAIPAEDVPGDARVIGRKNSYPKAAMDQKCKINVSLPYLLKMRATYTNIQTKLTIHLAFAECEKNISIQVYQHVFQLFEKSLSYFIFKNLLILKKLQILKMVLILLTGDLVKSE